MRLECKQRTGLNYFAPKGFETSLLNEFDCSEFDSPLHQNFTTRKTGVCAWRLKFIGDIKKTQTNLKF